MIWFCFLGKPVSSLEENENQSICVHFSVFHPLQIFFVCRSLLPYFHPNIHTYYIFERYADVVVHRLLAAAIGVGPLPPQLEHKGGLHDLAENMNRRHRSAQLAGRASVQLHTQLYFKDHPAVNEKVGAQEEDRQGVAAVAAVVCLCLYM